MSTITSATCDDIPRLTELLTILPNAAAAVDQSF